MGKSCDVDAVVAAQLIRAAGIRLFCEQVQLAAWAVPCGYKNCLIDIWNMSANDVTTLAWVGQRLPTTVILPSIPLPVYRTALSTEAPLDWLKNAILHRWSNADLRRAIQEEKTCQYY